MSYFGDTFNNTSNAISPNGAAVSNAPYGTMMGGASLFKNSFMGHIFGVSEFGKNEMMNVTQYSFMGIVPVLLLNYSIQKLLPDPDGEATSLVIIAEIIAQVLMMFIGLLLIHRTIDYIPTISGMRYEPLHLTSVILAMYMIVLSLQTKIGIKCNILCERLSDAWYGAAPRKRNKNVRFSSIPTPPAAVPIPTPMGMTMPHPPQQDAGFNPAPRKAVINHTGLGSPYF